MNFAWSAMTTRSQHRARCAPTPAAVPFTAAMTGSSQSRMAGINLSWPSSIMRLDSPTADSGAPSGRGAGSLRRLMSAPGQNSFRPVAVITTARASKRPFRPLTREAIRSRMPGEMALPFSGLSMVIQATWFRISNRISSSRPASPAVIPRR